MLISRLVGLFFVYELFWGFLRSFSGELRVLIHPLLLIMKRRHREALAASAIGATRHTCSQGNDRLFGSLAEKSPRWPLIAERLITVRQTADESKQ